MTRNSMHSKNYYLGKAGEDIVYQHLISEQYTILKRRYKSPYGEIDIIAQAADTLAFIEVKARKKLTHMEVLPPTQVQRIIRTSEYFLSEHDAMQWQNIRFDLVIVAEGRIFSYLKHAWII